MRWLIGPKMVWGRPKQSLDGFRKCEVVDRVLDGPAEAETMQVFACHMHYSSAEILRFKSHKSNLASSRL